MAWNMDDYEPVEDRVRAFYSDHPNGRILTELQHHNQDFTFVIFKATVYRDGDLPAADGTAFETVSQRGVNSTSHIENCETSAIGRALANLGYGAKGKRPSREEMQKVSDSAGSAPASASQSAPPAEPKAQASRPGPNHSEGGADGSAHTPSSQAADIPASPSDQISEGPVVGEVAGSSEAPTQQLPGGDSQQGVIADPDHAAPPAAESWLLLIENFGQSNVLKAAQEKAKEAGEKLPFTKKALNDLSKWVFDSVATELAETERVAS